MSIELVTKYKPYTDEVFAAESKTSLLTNNDIDWTGAKTVKVYKVTTAPMNDYDRDGTCENWSRYGAVAGLDATTEELTNNYKRLWEEEIYPNLSRGLSSAIYTQTSDIEEEVNGVMTYDREIDKLEMDTVYALNQKLYQMFDELTK